MELETQLHCDVAHCIATAGRDKRRKEGRGGGKERGRKENRGGKRRRERGGEEGEVN